ncbi:MAG: ribulose-phosphate 3-epimerase, partial [Bacteroidales bacterium]|nr:ribulose-phosphate 3-epimerase [Bacteroidales bacterium]
MKHLIAPSMLSSDFLNLEREIEMINNSEADWFHLDIMDGLFVPNITFGQPVVKFVKKFAKKPLDVHLMIVQPERYFQDFKDAGADILSFHYEASIHLHRSIYAVKNLNMKAGVTLNPHTNVNLLGDVIGDLDMVLIMSVNPGFGGQKFIENSYQKIADLKEIILKHNSKALIEVDGGVTFENAEKLVKCGVDILVAGNTVFSYPDPKEAIV